MIKVRNQTMCRNNVELIQFEQDATVGEYFETIHESLKNDNIACKITTKEQYDGMANFIFFYKFGKMYLHHSTDRDDFKLDDIKDLPVHCVRIKKMESSLFYIDDKIGNREEEKTLALTFAELQIVLNFIEETNDAHMKYETKILQPVYDKLMKIYKKYETFTIKNLEIELSVKMDLEMQQYISLYLYLKQQILNIHNERNRDVYWDRMNIIKRLQLINDKIERVCGKKAINGYPLYSIKD